MPEWGENTLYLAFDTSMLWGRYCIIRVCVVYRGRAVPLAWEVIEHRSTSVSYRVYRRVLHRVPALLPSQAKHIVLLADRGFADVALMKLCKRLKWGFRIRIKGISRSIGNRTVFHRIVVRKSNSVYRAD